MCEAAAIKNIAEVRRLLDNDADPNQADTDDLTALMYAAGAGHPQIVTALLDSGADPNQAGADDLTALMYAAGRRPPTNRYSIAL